MKYVLGFILVFILSSCFFLNKTDDFGQVELTIYKEKLTIKDKPQKETVITFRVPEDSIEIVYKDSVLKRMKLNCPPNEARCNEVYKIQNDQFSKRDYLLIRFLTIDKVFLIPINKRYRIIDLYYKIPKHEYTIRNAILNYRNSIVIVM